MPSYKITSQSGNPDQLLQFVDELVPLNQLIYPIYEFADTFTYDIKFYDVDPITTEDVVCEIESFSYSLNASGFTASQIDINTIRVTGRAENAFTDSYYKFLTKEYEVKILPSTTTDYITLIEWSPPSTSVKDVTHSFSVRLNNSTILGYVPDDYVITVSQQIHWRWQPALARFQEILSKGTI